VPDEQDLRGQSFFDDFDEDESDFLESLFFSEDDDVDDDDEESLSLLLDSVLSAPSLAERSSSRLRRLVP
jgi:hypothetical protein